MYYVWCSNPISLSFAIKVRLMTLEIVMFCETTDKERLELGFTLGKTIEWERERVRVYSQVNITGCIQMMISIMSDVKFNNEWIKLNNELTTLFIHVHNEEIIYVSTMDLPKFLFSLCPTILPGSLRHFSRHFTP